jgi:hypothetical protein
MAAPVAINEASFEGIDVGEQGWTNNFADSGWVGRNGTDNEDAFVEGIGFTSEGDVAVGMVDGYYIFQELIGNSFKARHRYILTVGIGHRASYISETNESYIGLSALLPFGYGSATLQEALDLAVVTEVVNASTYTDPDSFTDASVQITFNDDPPEGDIVILAGGGGGNRSHFDNFRLEEISLELDTDNDGIPDGSEPLLGTMVGTDDSVTDNDADGQSNFDEYVAGTNINSADTDKDGLTDDLESATEDSIHWTQTSMTMAPSTAPRMRTKMESLMPGKPISSIPIATTTSSSTGSRPIPANS